MDNDSNGGISIMSSTVKRFIRYWFPLTVKSIEEDIHNFYKKMGIEFEYVIPELDLPTTILEEGKPVELGVLHMIARPKISALTNVQIW